LATALAGVSEETGIGAMAVDSGAGANVKAAGVAVIADAVQGVVEIARIRMRGMVIAGRS